LGAVVQIAFEPAAFGEARLDDAGTAGSDLVELYPQGGAQAGVFEGQRAGGHGNVDDAAIALEGRVEDGGG
jgi:hypothetical protein